MEDLWSVVPPLGLGLSSRALSKLLLLTVRFLRSIKSLGLRSTLPAALTSLLLMLPPPAAGRTLLALGSSESSDVSSECGGNSRFNVSTPSREESPLESSEVLVVSLLLLLLMTAIAGVVLGPISTNLTLHDLVVVVVVGLLSTAVVIVVVVVAEEIAEAELAEVACGSDLEDCPSVAAFCLPLINL